MVDLKLVVVRQASEMGQLFGSVTARDVVDAAQTTGHTLNRMQVQIDTPIKALGLFPVKIKLHPEVIVKVTINVARSIEEAVVQAEKGAALIKANAERAEVEAAFAASAEPAAAETVAEEGAEEAKKPAKKAKKADADEGEEPAKVKKPRVKKAAE